MDDLILFSVLLSIFIQPSFQKAGKQLEKNILVRNSNNLPGCFGSLKPEIVQSTEYKATYPASNVLILGEEDVFFDHLTNGTSNLWLAEDKSTSGHQSSTFETINCYYIRSRLHNQAGQLREDDFWLSDQEL